MMRLYNPYANQYTQPYNHTAGYTPGWNPCLDGAYDPYGSYIPMGSGYLPMSEPAPMCPPGAAPYTIEEGDTLYSIARMVGATVADLIAANPGLSETSMLYIGQTLCVPLRKPMPEARPCPVGSVSYTVMPGDTLTGIAERFSVSVYALTIANPGFSAESLIPGTQLCITPFSCLPVCVENERYRIMEGEDLAKLAMKLQVSTDDLLKANPFSPPCWFMPGYMICLPENAVLPETKQK